MTRRIALSGVVLALGIALALPGARRKTGAGGVADTARVSGAIAFFEARLARDSQDYVSAGQLIPRYFVRFQTAADLADLERAAAAARAALTLTPDSATTLARLGAVGLARHDFAGAYETAERALALNPENEEAVALLFDAAMATGRYALAESSLERLPAGGLARQVRLAQLLDARGNAAGASHVLRRVCQRIEIGPHRPEALAWCLVELGNVERARAGAGAAAVLYRRALKVLPAYRGAVEALADLAHARGDWREARRLYGPVAADAHPDIYLRLAEAARCVGDHVAARRYEARFVSIAGAADAEPLYGRELALFYAERPATRDLAEAIARRDVGRRPAVESWDVLSWTRLRRGDFGGALEAAESARRWGAPTGTMNYHLAIILDSLGRHAEAAALRASVSAADRSTLDPHVRLATAGACRAVRSRARN